MYMVILSELESLILYITTGLLAWLSNVENKEEPKAKFVQKKEKETN